MRSRLCNHCKTWSQVSEWGFGCPSCGESNHIPRTDYRVMPDQKPYKSVVTGEEISGRRQHREHLMAHNLIEVGNEFNKPKPQKIDRKEIVQDILRTTQQLRSR